MIDLLILGMFIGLAVLSWRGRHQQTRADDPLDTREFYK